MGIIHSKFKYKNKTNEDFDLIVGSFNANSGESDTFLSMEDIVDPIYDGRFNYDYGAKYNNVAQITIELMKEDGSDISPTVTRSVLAWLTGSRDTSWLELIQPPKTAYDCGVCELHTYELGPNGECPRCGATSEVITERQDPEQTEYSWRGRFIDAKLYRMDARVVGIVAVFKATSPWAYSNLITHSLDVDRSAELRIDNATEDLYSYIYPDIVFTNNGGSSLEITTSRSDVDNCTISNLGENETVTMQSNQIIYSDSQTRIFGHLDNDGDFNFKWLKLYPGNNILTISGNGRFELSYRYPMKVADGVTDLSNNVRNCD